MEIEYTFPGSIEVVLDDDDGRDLAFYRHVHDRNGFRGIESKTWVRIDDNPDLHTATATIDGDGDLNITVPSNSSAPTIIEAKDVKPGNSADRGIVTHFLGATGTITLDTQRRKRLSTEDSVPRTD